MRRFPLLFLTLSLLLISSYPISAVIAAPTTYTVTKTADTNDGTCDADCSLREAITAANANSGSTVNIPSGTYTITRAGADEDNNATGDFDINAVMTITGAGASTTIIDGNDLDRIFHITGNFSVNISGVTVRNGYLADNVTGAGILNPTGMLNLNAVVVTENSAPFGRGGGISCNDGSSLSITDSTISYNTARFFGGGIQCMGTITILNSILTFNETTDAGLPGGGAIYHFTLQDSPLTITSSTISNNTAADIGGVYSYVDTGNSLTLTDSIVSNNTGGVLIFGGSITNTTFSGNNSTRHGGAILVGDGTASIMGSTFVNNTSTVGGGAVAALGSVTISNSSFSANSSPKGTVMAGDDVEGSDQTHDLNLIHTTFANAPAGGGVYMTDRATVTSFATIFGNNMGGNCVFSPTPGGVITSMGYNISSDASCNLYFTAAGDLNNTNPLLAALANNGGLTQTMALLAGSPAINRVPSANCTLLVDQRGIARPVGSGCDSGAYESNSTPAPLPSEAPQRNYFTTSTPTLTWSRVTTAASYIIEVDTDRNFTAPFAFRATGITSTSITTDPLPDGTYYWRVRMVNANGIPGMWSLVDSFVVDVP